MTDSRFFILLPQFLEGTVPENSLSRASNYLKSRHFTKKKKKKVASRCPSGHFETRTVLYLFACGE